jgi:hypothetical protein
MLRSGATNADVDRIWDAIRARSDQRTREGLAVRWWQFAAVVVALLFLLIVTFWERSLGAG